MRVLGSTYARSRVQRTRVQFEGSAPHMPVETLGLSNMNYISPMGFMQCM